MIHAFYTAATAQDAAVTWIAPEDTEIVAVRWCVDATSAVDGGNFQYELSFAAASQHTGNDIVNVIDALRGGVELTTSGAALIAINDTHVIPGGVRIEAGEKVYLHVNSTTFTVRCRLFIYTSARTANKSSFRRR